MNISNEQIFELMTKMYSELTTKIDVIGDDVTILKSDVNTLKSDVSTLKEDVNILKEDVNTLKYDVSTFKKDVTSLKHELSETNKKVDKNTILIEDMRVDIKTLAEGQQAFSEQLGRSRLRENTSFNERLDIIELAVKSNSKDISVIKDTVELLKDKTGSHEMDILLLKRNQEKMNSIH